MKENVMFAAQLGIAGAMLLFGIFSVTTALATGRLIALGQYGNYRGRTGAEAFPCGFTVRGKMWLPFVGVTNPSGALIVADQEIVAESKTLGSYVFERSAVTSVRLRADRMFTKLELVKPGLRVRVFLEDGDAFVEHLHTLGWCDDPGFVS